MQVLFHDPVQVDPAAGGAVGASVDVDEPVQAEIAEQLEIARAGVKDVKKAVAAVLELRPNPNRVPRKVLSR